MPLSQDLERMKRSATPREWIVVETLALAVGLLWRYTRNGCNKSIIIPEKDDCPSCKRPRIALP